MLSVKSIVHTQYVLKITCECDNGYNVDCSSTSRYSVLLSQQTASFSQVSDQRTGLNWGSEMAWICVELFLSAAALIVRWASAHSSPPRTDLEWKEKRARGGAAPTGISIRVPITHQSPHSDPLPCTVGVCTGEVEVFRMPKAPQMIVSF